MRPAGKHDGHICTVREGRIQDHRRRKALAGADDTVQSGIQGIRSRHVPDQESGRGTRRDGAADHGERIPRQDRDGRPGRGKAAEGRASVHEGQRSDASGLQAGFRKAAGRDRAHHEHDRDEDRTDREHQQQTDPGIHAGTERRPSDVQRGL